MKKTYFTPEIDIVKFSLTDLIMGPSINEGANGDFGGDFGSSDDFGGATPMD